LEAYIQQQTEFTPFIFHFHQTNTCRILLLLFQFYVAKMILQLLEVLKRMSEGGVEITIDRFYNIGYEQLKEDGEELSFALDLPFNFQSR
jgi:hypothetical protein